MNTMGDLLGGLRQFSSMDCTREAASEILGQGVREVSVHAPSDEESVVLIRLEREIFLEVRYFLNPGLLGTYDDCEFGIRLGIDLRSLVRYNVFYSPYIHGQGYMRIALGDVDNPLMKKVLDEYYLPRLKAVYKPLILRFKGFFSRDYFGIYARADRAHLYYSSVRARREEMDADFLEVVARLYDLEALLSEGEVRHKLAELDMQMSVLSSVIWM